MLTCKSPRKVMLLAHRLAKGVLPDHSSRFSRHDFTLPQLFACLVVREHQKKSFRGIEALLRDSQHWCNQIGMSRVPDHNTLCRAFHVILNEQNIDSLLDLLARWCDTADLLGKTLAIDSSHYDTHHQSRHYEQRCRHLEIGEKTTVNAKRSASAHRKPKLSIGVDTRSHFILSTRARIGMGSDCLDFNPLLRAAHKRHPLRVVLADAGYDSESNHRIARDQLGICSLIKTSPRRRSRKLPSGRYRRLMHRTLRGSQKNKRYGQRAQAETANSMLKRNLGDCLRARSDQARRLEQLLRIVTHDVMLLKSLDSRVETEPFELGLEKTLGMQMTEAAWLAAGF